MRIQLKLCMKRRVYLHLWDPIVTKKNSSCYWSEVRLEMRPLIPRSRQYTKPMIITRINKLAKPYSSTSNANGDWLTFGFDSLVLSTSQPSPPKCLSCAFQPKSLRACAPVRSPALTYLSQATPISSWTSLLHSRPIKRSPSNSGSKQ
jgi:hypothetical protein